MKKLTRIFSLILLVLTLACLFAGCVQVPKDDIEINVISSKGTYRRQEDITELFFALDVLNGKERDVTSFDMELVVYMRDGNIREETVHYDKKVDYARSSLVRFTLYYEGRVDELHVRGFSNIQTANYWKTFGGMIISSCITFLVIGILFAVFMAAEMSGILSVGAGAVVLFDIAMLIFLPFVESIILVLASILAFVPMLIYNAMNY